jgi:hypothetical protein
MLNRSKRSDILELIFKILYFFLDCNFKETPVVSKFVRQVDRSCRGRRGRFVRTDGDILRIRTPTRGSSFVSQIEKDIAKTTSSRELGRCGMWKKRYRATTLLILTPTKLGHVYSEPYWVTLLRSVESVCTPPVWTAHGQERNGEIIEGVDNRP